jgi:hypothetical protein
LKNWQQSEPPESVTRQANKNPITKLHIIDPTSIFIAFMSSDVGQKMHSGLAHFVDEPEELYHSHSWASSVRANSPILSVGRRLKKAVYRMIDSMIDVVFPSDIVLYCCTITHCPCQAANAEQPHLSHIGRVYDVGRDYRNDFCTGEKDQIALQIQEVFGPIHSRQEAMQPCHPFVVVDLLDPPKEESDMVLDTRIM